MNQVEGRITRKKLEDYIQEINENILKESDIELNINRCGSVLNIEAIKGSKSNKIIYQGTVRECYTFVTGISEYHSILNEVNQ